jgi:hypothetical protein
MEAVKSPTSFEAIEYVLVAAPAALFLSLYLLGGLLIPKQFEAPKACHLNAKTEYAAPRG